jgi:hypothetical protein
MPALVYAPNAFIFEAIATREPDLLKRSDLHFLVTDLNALGYLPPNSAYTFFGDLVPGEELDPLAAEALSLSQQLYQPLADLTHRGVSLLNTFHLEAYHPLLSCLNTARAFERLLAEQPWSELFLCSGLCYPDYWNLARTAESDSVCAVMALLAQQHGLPVTWLQPTPQADEHTQFIRYMLSQTGAHAAGAYPVPPEGLQPLKPGRCIFLLGWGLELNDQALLAEYLAEDPDTYFVFLSFQNTPQYYRSESALYLDMRYFTSWPHPLSEQEAAIEARWQELPSYWEQAFPERAALLNNPFWRFQHQLNQALFKGNLRVIEAMHILYEHFQPVLTLSGGTHKFSPVKTAVDTLTQRGVPNINFMHGGILFPYNLKTKVFTVDSSLAVRGKIHYQQLAEFWEPFERSDVRVIGELRKNLPTTKGRTSTHKNKPSILLLSSRLGHGMYNISSSMHKHLETWLYIEDLIQKYPNWEFQLKPHPGYDYFGFYSQMQGDTNLTIIEQTTPLRDILPQADVAIAINVPTSSIVEAALAEVPTLYLCTTHKQGSEQFKANLEPYIWQISTLSELEPAILSLLENTDEQKKRLSAMDEFKELWSTAQNNLALDNAKKFIASKIGSPPAMQPKASYGQWIQQITHISEAHFYWRTGNGLEILQQRAQTWHRNTPQERQEALENYLNFMRTL